MTVINSIQYLEKQIWKIWEDKKMREKKKSGKSGNLAQKSYSVRWNGPKNYYTCPEMYGEFWWYFNTQTNLIFADLVVFIVGFKEWVRNAIQYGLQKTRVTRRLHELETPNCDL